MFSTTQLDLLQPLAEAMYNDGYIYYVAHTNTNLSTSSYNTYDFYDLSIYFSKSEIKCTDYNFKCADEVIRIDYITRNVSNNNSDSKLNRIRTIKVDSLNVNINPYEHIFTNSTNSLFADCLAMVEHNNNNNIAYNLTTNDFFVIPVLLSAVLLFSFLKMWFGRLRS